MIPLFLLLLLVGCSQNPSPTTFTGTAMTIDYRIVIGSHAKTDKSAPSCIREVFEEVDAIYNKFNPQSEISHLNRLPAGVRVPLSPQLAALLRETAALVHLTKGKFDPSIEPIQQLWKEKFKQGIEPTEEEIAALKPAVGWDKIHIEEGHFFKDHDLTCLDLGGIAKGYCVDLLVERLQSAGYPNSLVEWGGEMRGAGQHPEKRPWRVFISNLNSTDPRDAIAKVELNNQAIATSGDYMQFWQIGDKTYTHIFDPHQLRPLEVTATSIASASVLSHTCTFSDGIAKVGMLFETVDEAKEWAEEIRSRYSEARFWFVTRQ